jgi:hypothetical protein
MYGAAMIFNLPEALLSVFLSEWVTMTEVARMDSAFCNATIRSEFLNAAYNVGRTLQYPPNLSSKITIPTLVDRINEWVLNRGASIPGFYATNSFQSNPTQWLSYLKKFGKSIRWIDQQEYGLNTASALKVVKHCPNLTRFNCSSGRDVPDILILISACPSLVEISGDFSYTEDKIIALAKGCTLLRKVHLNCIYLTDESLIALIRSNPGLTEFSVRAFRMTDKTVNALALSCSQLTSLSVTRCFLSQASIYFLIKHCRKLHHCCFTNCTLAPAAEAPELSTSMRMLRIFNSHVPTWQLNKLLEACPALDYLHVLHDGGIRASDVLVSTLCPSLHSLCIVDSRLKRSIATGANSLVQGLGKRCTNLYALVLEGVDAAPEDWYSIATSCPLLVQVRITFCIGSTDEFVNALAENCSGLEELLLNNCRNVTDSAIEVVLRRCLKLTELKIYGCRHVSAKCRAVVKQRGL